MLAGRYEAIISSFYFSLFLHVCCLCWYSCSSLPGAAYLPMVSHHDREFFDFVSQMLDPCHESRPTKPWEHPFFRGVDWDALAAKELPAPWLPSCNTESLPNVAVPEDHPARLGQ